MVRYKRYSSYFIMALVTYLCLSSTSIFAAELPEIIRRGKLIVAVKNDLRPLGFSDINGNLQGFEIDIARRLAEELLGNADAIIFQSVSNQNRLQVVLDGQVDLTIARVTITPSRSRLVNFSPYYYLDGTGLITKKNAIQTLADLANRKIAVLQNSSTIADIRSELPQAKLIGVNSYKEAFQLLETGQADAFAADNSILAGWVQDYPQYHQLSLRLSGEALAIVMPKGLQYKSLHNKVNEAIIRWQKSGWLQERATYWGLP